MAKSHTIYDINDDTLSARVSATLSVESMEGLDFRGAYRCPCQSATTKTERGRLVNSTSARPIPF